MYMVVGGVKLEGCGMHTRVVTFHSIPSPTQTSSSRCPATFFPYDMPTVFTEPLADSEYAYSFVHRPHCHFR